MAIFSWLRSTLGSCHYANRICVHQVRLTGAREKEKTFRYEFLLLFVCVCVCVVLVYLGFCFHLCWSVSTMQPQLKPLGKSGSLCLLVCLFLLLLFFCCFLLFFFCFFFFVVFFVFCFFFACMENDLHHVSNRNCWEQSDLPILLVPNNRKLMCAFKVLLMP